MKLRELYEKIKTHIDNGEGENDVAIKVVMEGYETEDIWLYSEDGTFYFEID